MRILPLLALGLGILGCSSGGNLSLRTETQNAVDQGEDELDLLVLTPGDEIYISAEEYLADVLLLYSEALDSAEAGNNMAAQNLFDSAILSLTELDPESLDVSNDDLEWLRMELIRDYASFLSNLPELPAESSPSAVYLSLSEFLGDSIYTREDLIDLVLSTSETSLETDTTISKRAYPNVPLIVNSYVENALTFYQTKGRKVFSKWLERAEEAIPYYTALLEEEGLPDEVVYLAMIESGFSTSAYSRSHASGPWQFIASTARIFGLEVSYWYDERRDPELSTRAACRYLKNLHDKFNDWYLAFAAYNCGERRLNRAMKRAGQSNYWALRRHLPRQTRDYVPSYLAARIICQNPTQYGFEPLNFRVPPETELAPVDGCVDLKEVARCADADYKLIKALNPALKRGCTPPNARNFSVRLPVGAAEQFSERVAKAPRLEKSEWVRHRIRRGETLSTIAAKYRVSMRSILEIPANKLKNPHRIRAGRYLLIPVKERYVASRNEPRTSKSQPSQLTSYEGKDRIVYRVRKGDALSTIAQKHGVRIADLKSWNHLWSERYIYPGQKLIIWTKSSRTADGSTDGKLAEGSTSNSSGSELRTHQVQPGDTLWDISRLYGVSVKELKEWNGIRSAYRLKPGSVLKLQP